MADENEAKSEDKAAVETNTSEKKVPEEMPPTYDEANPLTGAEESSVKITSNANETKIDIGKEKEAFEGLTKEELMKYANDPYWVRLRWILFIFFWIIWVAMLVASIVIIIYAPKCPSPEPKEWWQKNSMYKIDVKNFDDGTLNGLKNNLDLLVESGVGTIYISSFFQTTGKGTRADITDYQSVDARLGSLEDWKSLVSALMDRDQKVVIDFIPNHTSEHHEWFEQSVSELGKFSDFYIWNEGGGRSSPPATWPRSAWTWNADRGAWYLHRAGAGYPDLNLKNPEVIKELEDVMKFWIDTGVNGFVVNDIEILADADDTSDATILSRFRDTVDATSEDTGIPCVLMAASSDNLDSVVEMYGDVNNAGIGNKIQLPLYSQQVASPKSASDLNEKLSSFLSQMPNAAWPSFAFSSLTAGEKMTDAMTMLKMLLPGTPVFTPGQELGLDSWSRQTAEEQIAAEESHLKVFSALASKMRHQESILFGEINQNTTFVIDNVFGLTRVKKGNPGYLLLINFGDTDAEVDVSEAKYVPEGIRLMTRSVGETETEEAEIMRYESTSVLVKPSEGRVFTFVPKYD